MSGQVQISQPCSVQAIGVEPEFKPGERIRIRNFGPVGPDRLPISPPGKHGVVERVGELATLKRLEEASTALPDRGALAIGSRCR